MTVRCTRPGMLICLDTLANRWHRSTNMWLEGVATSVKPQTQLLPRQRTSHQHVPQAGATQRGIPRSQRAAAGVGASQQNLTDLTTSTVLACQESLPCGLAGRKVSSLCVWPLITNRDAPGEGGRCRVSEAALFCFLFLLQLTPGQGLGAPLPAAAAPQQ